MMKGQKILVDSNVILDIILKDKKWFDWSSAQISSLAEENLLIINPIIYSEVSIGFKLIEDLENALPRDYIKRECIPWEAAFLAGKVFFKYRKRGENKLFPFPDFLIGAHALVKGMLLLTRDVRRYKTNYPALELIAP